jgi:hypothetical protein
MPESAEQNENQDDEEDEGQWAHGFLLRLEVEDDG